jgi:hypothetical protein
MAAVSGYVTDAKGNPLGEAGVSVLPNHIASEAILAAAFVSGQTDQTGT